jgi:tRNA threonylcarbamoyladenosine biosynthesis protein TsaB
MRILGLDCSASSCSAALWADGAVRARRFDPVAEGQAERVIPMAEAVMAEAGMSYAALSAIVATTGPGRFTGVRVGLAAARGLALASGVQAWGVSTTEALGVAARAAMGPIGTLAVALECKRRELAFQVFAESSAGDPILVTPEDGVASLPAGDIVLVGDGAPRLLAALDAVGRTGRIMTGFGQPDAVYVVALAATRLEAGLSLPLPRPIYARPPDVMAPLP